MNAPIARLSASTRSGTMSTTTTGFPWQDGDFLYAADLNAAFNTAGVGNFLPISGGQLTGPLYLYSNPTISNGAATKSYVDTAIGGTIGNPASQNIGRNLLHNSLFNVTQRGTAVVSTSGGYPADRWVANTNLDALGFQVFALNDSARIQIGDEAAVFALGNTFTGNAGAAAISYIEQRIEGVRRLSGKTVTVSFWAASNGTLKLGVNLTQVFGTGGSPSGPVTALAPGAAITTTTAYARYSTTIAIPSATGMTLGTNGNDYTALRLFYSSGATSNTQAGNIGVQSGTINIWGVQLEIGSVATPLEKPDPRYDLANCQRFACLMTMGMSPGIAVTCGYQPTFPVPMRATPAAFNIAAGTPSSVTFIGETAQDNRVAFFQITTLTTGGFYLNRLTLYSADL